MMQRTVVLALLLAGAVDAKAVNRGANARNHGFLSLKADMQPDVVAKSLVHVEDEWNAQASMFAECNASATSVEEMAECNAAPKAFNKACSTVVSAVVSASSGNKGDVADYMGTVCDQDVLKGWRGERCQSLALAITNSMSDDDYDNREHLDSQGLCTKFWTKVSADEIARAAAEKAAREAAEKKAEEERAEAEKKEAEERAAAEKKAEEEAAAEEQKRKEEEEAEKAAEAKKQAEEAAAKMAERNAEAERVAAEADKKLAEVKGLSSNATSNATAPAADAAAAPADAAAAPADATAAPADAAPAADAVPAVVFPANATVNSTNATVANTTNATKTA